MATLSAMRDMLQHRATVPLDSKGRERQPTAQPPEKHNGANERTESRLPVDVAFCGVKPKHQSPRIARTVCPTRPSPCFATCSPSTFASPTISWQTVFKA